MTEWPTKYLCDYYEEYESRKLDDLRADLRSLNQKGTWIVYTNKDACIYALYHLDAEKEYGLKVDWKQEIAHPKFDEKFQTLLSSSMQRRYETKGAILAKKEEVTQETTNPIEETQMSPSTKSLSDQIAELLTQGQQTPKPSIDEEKLREIVVDEIAKNAPRKIQVTTPFSEPKVVEAQHENFEDLLKVLVSGGNCFLVGEAGSGKTTAGFNVAESMGLPFGLVACNEMTDKLDFCGYMDAQGQYVKGPAYDLYKNGGVLIIDEMEKGGANAMTALNALLANGVFQFPNGEVVKKNDRFVAIACGNTFGRGASRQYVGANELDASTLDRFDVLEWDIDEKLESSIAQDKEWCSIVQALREAVRSFEGTIQLIVSMRATLRGEKLLAQGFNTKQVFEMLVYKGLDAQSKEKLSDKAAEIMESRVA